MPAPSHWPELCSACSITNCSGGVCPINYSSKLSTFFFFFPHWLFWTSDCFTLLAQMCITVHSKTLLKTSCCQSGLQPSENHNNEYLAVNTKYPQCMLSVWPPRWEGEHNMLLHWLGHTCTQHATLMVSDTHAHNMLLQEVLSALSFMVENKLKYAMILFNLLRDVNFFLAVGTKQQDAQAQLGKAWNVLVSVLLSR